MKTKEPENDWKDWMSWNDFLGMKDKDKKKLSKEDK